MLPPSRILSAVLVCALTAPAVVAHAQAPAARIIDCRVGFDGRYKLGFWTPVRVTIEGLGALGDPRLEVLAPDSDGAPAALATPLRDHPARRGEPTIVHTLTRVGRADATLLVSLWDGDTLVDQWRSGRDSAAEIRSIPATERLIVEVGSRAPIAEAMDEAVTARVAAEALPATWLGYEGVETLLVAGGDSRALAEMPPADRQIVAISDWVARGGRLVIAVGDRAPALLGQGGPLESLAPGRVTGVAPLVRTESIEEYAEAAAPVPSREQGAVRLAQVADVSGRVEAYAGGRAEGLPLVVRSWRGFGEVTFAAIDLDAPAIQQWSGGQRLTARVLGLSGGAGGQGADSGGALVKRGFNDLAGEAYVKLGESFEGVTTTPMTALVAAVVAYLAIIGPGAYLLGHRVLGRTGAAWVVLPLVIVAVGVAAYAWRGQSTGDRVRVNQLELVDVDCQTGFERGVAWAQVFSPRAARYDLSYSLAGAGRADEPPASGFLTWYGLPGTGLGGMQTPADSLLSTEAGYQVAATPEGLRGAPINLRASKAVTARWTATERPAVEMDLTATSAGLVEGVLTNATGRELRDCRLLYGGWGWRLPAMPPGAVVSVDASVRPARFRTILMRGFRRAGGEKQRSLAELAHLMMFSQELGGREYAGLDNAYQAFCDLSGALRAGRPVLLARCDEPRIRLMSGGEELDTVQPTGGAYFRFIGGPPQDETRRE